MYVYMQIYVHSVRISEIRGHVHFRMAREWYKVCFGDRKYKQRQLNDNVKNKLTNHILKIKQQTVL